MVGNIFYSFKEIDETGELFKSWIELTGPVWELMGTETTDLVGMKRWLAFLEGGLLPIISLTSLHFFVKYEKPEETEKPTEEEIKKIKADEIVNSFEEEDVEEDFTEVTELETPEVEDKPKTKIILPKISPEEIKERIQNIRNKKEDGNSKLGE